MTDRRRARLALAASLALLAACDDGPAPTSPSPTSFLSGTWQGTLTIQPSGQTASTGPTTWTFTAVPQTNLQSFDTSIRSEHPWLAITLQGTAALAASATPPTQISTQGNYSSPRGCSATFGSLGTANATRIEATFHGVDCQVSFDGTVVLTKSGS
jgi:hypothetical protein